MRKININRERLNDIGGIAMKGVKLLAYGLIAGLSYSKMSEHTYATMNYYDKASFGDVVKVIMESDMYDSYKNKAISILPEDRDSEFYKAVISIIKSDMFDSYKLDSIKRLCEKK